MIIEDIVKTFKKNGRTGNKPPSDRNERSFRLAILIQQLSPFLFLPGIPALPPFCRAVGFCRTTGVPFLRGGMAAYLDKAPLALISRLKGARLRTFSSYSFPFLRPTRRRVATEPASRSCAKIFRLCPFPRFKPLSVKRCSVLSVFGIRLVQFPEISLISFLSLSSFPRICQGRHEE